MDSFGGQHLPLGSLPVDLRDAVRRLILEVLAEFGCRRCFQSQIHFKIDRFVERSDDVDRPQPTESRLQAFDVLGEPVEQIEVPLERLLYAGSEYLDGDVAAFRGHGVVDLRDGRRRNGFLAKL